MTAGGVPGRARPRRACDAAISAYGSPQLGVNGVPQVSPGPRVAQDPVADADPLALEDVVGLDACARRCRRARRAVRRSAPRSAAPARGARTRRRRRRGRRGPRRARLGHLLAELGQPEAGQPAVEHARGLNTSPWRSRWTTVRSLMRHLREPGAPRRSRGGRRQGVDETVERGVVVRGRDEPRLVGARGQVDPVVEHRMEERGVPPRLLGTGRVVVARHAVAEEDREQVSRARERVDDPRAVGGCAPSW